MIVNDGKNAQGIETNDIVAEKSRQELTLDDLQNGTFIYQNKNGFRFGIDAVLLSGFAKVFKGENVVDFGSGSGILGLLLSAKTEGESFTGIEYFEENVVLAKMSISYNHLEGRAKAVKGDIKNASGIFGKNVFNVVVTNPPYMTADDGAHSPDSQKAAARHEVLCTFDDVAREAAAVLKSNGRFYMIHRPSRLAEILSTLIGYGLEPKRLRLVLPFAGREPTMFLVEAVKGAKSGIKVEAPLVIYQKEGKYTKEVLKMYGM